MDRPDDQAIPPDAERHFAARMSATTQICGASSAGTLGP